MKAKTQYNDIKGTAAADVSDHQMNSLQYYLEKLIQIMIANAMFVEVVAFGLVVKM